MHEAERAYRRAGYTGPIDYTVMQVLMPGIKVHSASSAHRNGVGRPYELQLVGTDQLLTTVVDNKAQASQIVQKLAGKAAYVAESGGFRITYRPVQTDSLETLVQRHSMHVSGPFGTTLKDRLNFGSGAIVRVGEPCLPPDGVHSGGIAVDATGRPVTCVRIEPSTSVLDREWRLVGSGTPLPPPPLQYCDDGTSVSDRSMQCKDCWDGSNIHISGTCPERPVLESCGDGTLVADRAAECKDCWDGSNIPIVNSCPIQPTCGDGTLVTNRATDCKDCADGSNVPLATACPVGCLCGGFAPSLADCPSVALKSCPSGCPSVCPFDACATLARTGPTSCSTGFSLIEVPGLCEIDAACNPDACPCGAVREADGTCPAVDKTELGASSCTSPYTKVKVAETACMVTHECQQTCPCGGGTVTHPVACPAVVKEGLGPASCPGGYTRTKVAETTCDITYACQKACPCGGGTVTHPDVCPTIVKDELGPTTCPTDYLRSMVSSTECDITYACERNCPCDGGVVTHPATCPAVDKQELGPASCPTGYTRTILSETECEINYACQKTCPCEGVTVRHPDDCPTIVKRELGATSCEVGCDLVTSSETQCTITRACQQTCWDNSVVTCGGDCPDKPVSCANGNTYPDCCCATMTPIETEYEDRIEWSCPAKPIRGVPIDANPAPHWTIVTTETECYIQRDLVCTGSIGACFGPGNYCANPTQVFFNEVTGICPGPINQVGASCTTGYVCGENPLGP